MDTASDAHRVTSVETLEILYGLPSGPAVEKELDYLHPHYQKLIAASPFFLVPGVGETLRVNGRAEIRTDPALLERFVVEGRLPRTVLVVRVDTVFFQCARAIFRSKLWDPARHVARESLPSAGTIVSGITNARFGGQPYDDGHYERMKKALY